MTELGRRTRNEERIRELYPAFGMRIRALILDLELAGIRPRIQEAWRPLENQLLAYRLGKSKVRYGFHNITGPGGKPEALAVDLLDDDHPLHPTSNYLLRLAAYAGRYGMVTGIRWGCSREMVRRIDQAIAARNWRADVTVGWDPCHIEPTSLTIGEAWSGKRPA